MYCRPFLFNCLGFDSFLFNSAAVRKCNCICIIDKKCPSIEMEFTVHAHVADVGPSVYTLTFNTIYVVA